jgi:hypothetical protein
MEIDHLLQECRIEAVLDSLSIQSQSGRDTFKAQCKKRATNLKVLSARSDGWTKLLANTSSNWKDHVSHLLANEKILRSMDPATASASQQEDWSQILFTGEFASLNFLPFFLMYVAVSKIFLAPLIAWTMPFMTMILPFFALRFVYGIPISWEAYWATMKPMIFGSSDKPFSMSSLLQWGSMIVSYAHGMYLPYTNAKHCYAIDQKMIECSRALTDSIKRLEAISKDWSALGLRKSWRFPDVSFYGDERQVIAWLTEDKTLLPSLYRAIGLVEVNAGVTSTPHIVPVKWSQSATPYCKMVDGIDPLLKSEDRVPFTLTMGPISHHVICTGPNRGGKSTFLRSVLTNLVLAQGFGFAFATSCTLTPAEWILSSLRLEDRPGAQSLFEREVNVAGEILKRQRQGTSRGWVIIDELFHTTNPPDAATASQIFLQQIWASNRVSSLVSTHLFSHAENAPSHVQRLCVDSEKKLDSNTILYKYTVIEGLNTMSSVEEILLESKVLMPHHLQMRFLGL